MRCQIVGKWSFITEGQRKQENDIAEYFEVQDQQEAQDFMWDFINKHRLQHQHLDGYTVHIGLDEVRRIFTYPRK